MHQHRRRSRRNLTILGTTLVALLMLAAGASPAGAGGPGHGRGPGHGHDVRCENRNNNSVRKLLECVDAEGVQEHLAAFQEIADAHGGNRAAGTQGYDASVDYVAGLLSDAGYEVTLDPFEFNAFAPEGPSALEQVEPGQVAYVEDTDFGLLDQTDPGDVTAPVVAVDLDLGLGNASTSGCEPEDFAGFPAGAIALLQRGVCTFELKAENAAAAGAVGAIIMNQGDSDDPGRQGIPAVTLGNGNTSGIPVLGTTYALGTELAATDGLVMRVFANSSRVLTTSVNVLADSRHGDDDSVVVVGGHLDSVFEGPGINDNGSGTGTILEVALAMRKVRTHNAVRFAFWGAEEAGLVGSTDYVYTLPDEEREDIALYLNFDMLGSPNYARFVYDGDGDAFGLAGPDGSAEIEALFEGFYDDRGLAHEPTEISFRSDYAGFFDFGIPFGGLFSGAEGVKTPEQVAMYGGTAGEWFDPCYHQACDDIGNVSMEILDVNADAVAYATFTYAMAPTLPGGATAAP